jgi:hypothetical protein
MSAWSPFVGIDLQLAGREHNFCYSRILISGNLQVTLQLSN